MDGSVASHLKPRKRGFSNLENGVGKIFIRRSIGRRQAMGKPFEPYVCGGGYASCTICLFFKKRARIFSLCARRRSAGGRFENRVKSRVQFAVRLIGQFFPGCYICLAGKRFCGSRLPRSLAPAEGNGKIIERGLPCLTRSDDE